MQECIARVSTSIKVGTCFLYSTVVCQRNNHLNFLWKENPVETKLGLGGRRPFGRSSVRSLGDVLPPRVVCDIDAPGVEAVGVGTVEGPLVGKGDGSSRV